MHCVRHGLDVGRRGFIVHCVCWRKVRELRQECLCRLWLRHVQYGRHRDVFFVCFGFNIKHWVVRVQRVFWRNIREL